MTPVVLENPVARMVLMAGLFVGVVLVTYMIATAMAARRATQQRLTGDPPIAGQTYGGSLRGQQAEGTWLRLVESIERTGLPLVDTRDHALRNRLIAAGYSAPHAPRVYTLIRLIMVILLPVLLLSYWWMIGSRPSLAGLYFGVVISAALGLYIPSLFIRAKADRRQREIVNGFPDALDLMLVCVEAGLGLEAAFDRVGMEMTRSHPLLSQQLGAVVLELRAGRSREDALRRMADRAGVDEIRAFSTLLIQSTKLGSSVAQTLRTYASEMRERRRMRAEEKAHRLPVLLSIPLVACMLPVMIGVLMLPAAIRTIRAVMPALTGG